MDSDRIVPALLRWYRTNARDLPWRREPYCRDPYSVHVSEIMLQQTQVATVIPYYERWMKLFPDIRALAAAPEQQLLKAWEGLGYYSRPRNLRKAAVQILRDHGGVFPSDYNQVVNLPGIGPYTAGAICSIAFGLPTPILDGNVARVLSRVFMVAGDIKTSSTRATLWRLSGELVRAADSPLNKRSSANSPSALNQGLMELGAMVCTPRNPRCEACPLQNLCAARRQGVVPLYPQATPRKSLRRRMFFAFVLQHGEEFLVRRRAEQSINNGFWEFPNVEILPRPAHSTQIEQYLGFPWSGAKCWHTIRHTITSNAITVRVFRLEMNGEAGSVAERLGGEWQRASDLLPLPFTSAHSKIRARLLGPG